MKKVHIAAVVLAFILLSVLLGAMAAKIYENNNTAKNLRETDAVITYFTEAVKQNEHLTQVRAASAGGSYPALVLQENIAGQISETWFYVYDGNLCKFTASSGKSVTPEEGAAVMPLRDADFIMLEKDLLEIVFTTVSDQKVSFNLHISDMEGGLQ